MKNRMREIRTSGSVRDGDGDIPVYSAIGQPQAALSLRRQSLIGRIPIDLDRALEVLQQLPCMDRAASWRIGIDKT